MSSQSLRKLADDFLNLVHRSVQFLGNLVCGIVQFLIIDLNHPFQLSLCKSLQFSFFSALILNLVQYCAHTGTSLSRQFLYDLFKSPVIRQN